ALQPDFRLQRLVDLLRQAKLLVQRNLFGVELYSAHQCGLKAVGEAQNALVLLFVVHPDGREVGCDLVAQDAFDHVQIVIDQGRRLAVFGPGLDLFPQAFEEADVSPKFLFIGALGRGPNDESAVTVFAFALDNPLQTLALFIGRNLARNAGVVHRRHVDQKAARKGDVAGNARALLADWLFRNLDQDFLAFFQKIADLRNLLVITTPETAAAATVATSTEITAALKSLA